MSSIDKSKTPILEQKMDEAISIGINDPVLIEIYKNLNEVQKGIVRKLPEERRIPFLNFVKEAKEKEQGKLSKMNSQEKELYFKKKQEAKEKRKELLKLKKKTSSPVEEFLDEKKFSPVEKEQILKEDWDYEATNRELLEYAKPYSPPEWLKEDWNPEKMDKKNHQKKMIGLLQIKVGMIHLICITETNQYLIGLIYQK